MLKANDIKLLIIHCSDTRVSDEFDASKIHKMHLDFGWNGIGYHKVICRDGTIQNGRPEYWIGAHVKGKNHCSLGVCLVGKNKFTTKQFDSLEEVLKKWITSYPYSKIIGHSEAVLTKKTCPNFDVKAWCKIREMPYAID